jgi:hypothetical protein
MDPAGIIGHELIHALTNIYDPSRTDDEAYPTEVQERIQDELDAIEAPLR